jgi:hypothetical protein
MREGNNNLNACAQRIDLAEKMIKNVAVRVPEEIHKPVRLRIANEGGSFQGVILEFLKQWGQRDLKPGEVLVFAGDERPKLGDLGRLTPDEKWVDALLFVLRSGDKGPIDAVKSNLDQFVRVVKLAELVDRGGKRKQNAG